MIVMVATLMCVGARAEAPGSIGGFAAVYWGGVATNGTSWSLSDTNMVLYTEASSPHQGTWIYLHEGGFILTQVGNTVVINLEGGKSYYMAFGAGLGWTIVQVMDGGAPNEIWWLALLCGMLTSFGANLGIRHWNAPEPGRRWR